VLNEFGLQRDITCILYQVPGATFARKNKTATHIALKSIDRTQHAIDSARRLQQSENYPLYVRDGVYINPNLAKAEAAAAAAALPAPHPATPGRPKRLTAEPASNRGCVCIRRKECTSRRRSNSCLRCCSELCPDQYRTKFSMTTGHLVYSCYGNSVIAEFPQLLLLLINSLASSNIFILTFFYRCIDCRNRLPPSITQSSSIITFCNTISKADYWSMVVALH
jgi:hypothetical protein